MMHTPPRRHRLRALAAGAAVACAALTVAPATAFASPATAETSTDTAADASTLRIATSGFVDSFNPFISIYLLPTNSIRYMYESLVQNSSEDGSPTEGLAESWTTEDDGARWVFTL